MKHFACFFFKLPFVRPPQNSIPRQNSGEMLVLFALTIVSGVEISGETNQNYWEISNNHKKDLKQGPIARKHFDTFDTSDDSDDSDNSGYKEAYPDDGYKSTRNQKIKGRGDDYQDTDWQTVGKRKKLGKKRKTGEGFILMGRRARKGKGEDYHDTEYRYMIQTEGKRTRKGSRKGDDYQDTEWQTVGNRERKKMGKRKETGEDYKEMGEKKKAGEDFILMGKRKRKGKDYTNWLDKCSLKGKGKKTQVTIPGCGGLINDHCL